MTTYYIGVDGGGTRCRMRLTDENMETIAEDVIDSPSNLQVRNGSAAYGSILELTDSVFAKAGFGPVEEGQWLLPAGKQLPMPEWISVVERQAGKR